jgi:hypothetical protein
VLRQVAEREELARKAKQDEFLALKQMQFSEKQYQAVLSTNSAVFTQSALKKSTALW